MFRQVLSLTAIPEVPEKIAKMKVIVYKSRVDPATLKQKAEEMKSELFVKRFSKPKPEDIHVVSVDKFYEPYILVDAKYRIEYFIKKQYTFEVSEKAKEVRILGKTFEPQLVPVPGTEPEQHRKIVTIEGFEWSFYEDKDYFILNKDGKEITPDNVPIAPSEDNPEKILQEFAEKTEKAALSSREIIAKAKAQLVKRPSDVDTIDNEVFQVTEYALIYNPVYKITFRNTKTKEEKTVSINGVTGETLK